MAYDESSSTTPPPAFRLRWDVFLSFRGEDTRHGFTDRLYNALENKGVRVFRDDDGLNRGDEIAPGLLEAIEDSSASILIISPNYASSRWCLEELAKIVECRRLILPVFYQVDPSHVRRQKGPFEDSFRSLEERFGQDKGVRWRQAMEKAGGISGWVFQNSEEPQLIQSLVRRVLTELSNTPVGGASYTVGLDSRLSELMRLLDVKFNGIQFLGFHGMGGVGKTTLAKALYNKLVIHFECRSFVSSVRETLAQQNGFVSLQNKLIGDLSLGKVPPVNEVNAGSIAIKGIVRGTRVLIVLDDVDDISQLNVLGLRKKWFYGGSRIIITTRDRRVLLGYHVDEFYEVKELDSSNALQLFSYHALRREKPTENFLNLSKEIVSLTGGLPLALEVFGSFLFDKRRIEEWEDALQKLKQIRPHHLQDVLKISFNGLDEQEKCIFLDIACLFVQMQMKREDAIDILKGCGFRAEIAVVVLTAKSLIKITEDSTLWMHDQLRDMGKQIVRQENLVDPGMRSRLWDRDEIMTVLKGEMGTRWTQGIILDFQSKNFPKDPSAGATSWDNVQRTPAVTYLLEIYKKYFRHGSEKETEIILSTKSFEKMLKLRLLQINYVNLEGKFKFIPNELKWLQWKECPLRTLPSDFCPRGLTVLDLSESKIEQVWGWYTNKVAENLMVMNLRGCYNLTAIPDLSGHQALEKLILERCKGLAKIHKSIGNVNTLLHLNLEECSNLVEFPSDVSGLKHLEILILSGCLKLKELPEDIGSMKSLRELLVDKTAIAKLPESIFRLKKLGRLSLNYCQSLKRLPVCIGKLSSLREFSLNNSAIEEIPDSIGSLENLEKLSLMWCESLTAIPDSVGNLKLLTELLLNSSAIEELPATIGSLSYLKDLSLGQCQFLRKLPVSIGRLASIVELQLDGTPITDLPYQIGNLKALAKLEMRNCRSLSYLPESIGGMLTLTTLVIVKSVITELPESIGMLENLIMLRLNNCEKLCRLPDSIGKLKSLHHLLMKETAVTELPESFGMLSSLMILNMAKRPYAKPHQYSAPTELKNLREPEKPKLVVLPTSFSNLSSLIELNARAWKISGKIPDDFEKLSSLENLNLGHNNFCSLPSSLRGLSILKTLLLPHCKELKSLPPLPSSLLKVDATNCTAMEYISDLSDLKSLEELYLTNCEKLVDVPGIECMQSLRMLYMSGCNACSSVVKRRLSKAALKKLQNLSIPGSEIPDWFSREVVSFSSRKNREIKGVVICVVISVNHQISDDLRDELPSIVDIRATILKMNQLVYSLVLPLMGVPRTHEDQIHLCRFSESHPLVSKLKDGYKLQVTKQDPPYVKGIELKKFGIHLVFENDDDYDEDEESLDESQKSVSEKLVQFISSVEGVNHPSDFGYEVERETQEMEGSEEGTSSREVGPFCGLWACICALCSVFSS
ncbi:hypothetical protein L1049_005633 [Liquidambar formosana]|uniref:TIR domain-containing protein n=1 Tax=Liquidambar formosana TaxID=63359 RepID=A0AAP0RDZ8_LIQFO